MADIAFEMGLLLTGAQVRWTKVFAPVTFLLERKQDLIPMMRLHKANAMSVMLQDPDIQKGMAKAFPGDKFGAFLSDHIEQTALKDVDHLAAVIFDSALVFGHAILDDTLVQCLRIGYRIWPHFYAGKVAQRKISVAEFLDKKADEVVDQIVDAWLQAVERDSMIQKFELLLALTKPKDIRSILKGFDFDLKKIEGIDRLRHDLVHKTKPRVVTFDDLEYMSKATNFATSLMVSSGAPLSIQGLIDGMGGGFKLPQDSIYQSETGMQPKAGL